MPFTKPAIGSSGWGTVLNATLDYLYSRIDAATGALIAESTFLPRAPTVQYMPIAGVIRKSAGLWAPINDAAHTPTNIESVEVIDDLRIRIHYGFTGTKAVTFGAWLDETYAYQGFHVGASVNRDYADLFVYQTRNVGGYVNYNGSTWVGNPSADITSMVFSAGVLTITHADVGSTVIAAVVGRGTGDYLYRINSITATTTLVAIRNRSDGALVSAPASNHQLYFDRGVARRTVPISSMGEGFANLWIYGLMEA